MSKFSQATFDWMLAMSLNNTRDHFLALKPQFESEVKQPFTQLLTELAETFGGTPKVLRPNRDIRFSTDKRPYKTNISGFLDGQESTYYLELSMDGLMAATGYYQMAKDQLVKYRATLTTAHRHPVAEELRKIIVDTGATGEGLKTTPLGIPKDHPNADLLRFKSLTCSAVLPTDDVLTADTKAFASTLWHRAEPLNTWLNAHVGPSAEEM